MAKSYDSLNDKLISFIKAQKIFFVASAGKEGNVNLSPKGYDTLNIIDEKSCCYLDYPGSGNETAIHMLEDGRVTIMFCSFDEKPLILRLYGRGDVVGRDDERFSSYLNRFEVEHEKIVRQIFLIKIDSVLTSCGYGVPFFDYKGEREQLREWSVKKADEGTLGKYMGSLKRLF